MKDVLMKALAVAAVAAVTSLAVACGGDGGEGAAPGTSGPVAAVSDQSVDQGADVGPAPEPLAERQAVKVAVAAYVEPFAPVLLADQLGEYERENLDVELVKMGSTDALVQLLQGSVDLLSGGLVVGHLNAAKDVAPFKFLANVHQTSPEDRTGLWLRDEMFDDQGEVIEEKIPGMRIALGGAGVASPTSVVVDEWLQGHGHRLGDVEVLPLSDPDMIIALQEGSIDGGYLNTPAWAEAEERGLGELVTLVPPLAASYYAVSSEGLEQRSEVIDALMRAQLRTVRTYLQGDYHDDEEVVAALSEAMDTPVEAITSAPPLRFDPEMGLDTGFLVDAQDTWLELGDLLEYEEARPVDEIIDRTVVEDLLAGATSAER